jgi:general secretion pathway protein G
MSRVKHVSHPVNPVKSQKGFTLIEIMVVVIIIGVLTALIAPNIIGQSDQARVTAAKADIRTISQQLDLYKLDNYAYPSTQQGLQALVTKPGGSPEPKNWKKGGYLPKVPTDPWGNSYVYISPGSHGDYDLISLGADGRQGGEEYAADITSWE